MVDSTNSFNDNAGNPLPLGIAAVDLGVDHVTSMEVSCSYSMLSVELFFLVVIANCRWWLFMMKQIQSCPHVPTKHQLRWSLAVQHTTWSGPVYLKESLERF